MEVPAIQGSGISTAHSESTLQVPTRPATAPQDQMPAAHRLNVASALPTSSPAVPLELANDGEGCDRQSNNTELAAASLQPCPRTLAHQHPSSCPTHPTTRASRKYQVVRCDESTGSTLQGTANRAIHFQSAETAQAYR